MPRVFDDKTKARFVELTKRGRPPALAAEDVGFTWATVRKHMKDDPDFLAAYDQAVLVVDSRVAEVAYDLAVSGDSPASTWKWLERRQRAEWADQKNVTHTVSGPNGGPIQLAAVTTQALREVLTGSDTREVALAMVDQIPAIEATARENP